MAKNITVLSDFEVPSYLLMPLFCYFLFFGSLFLTTSPYLGQACFVWLVCPVFFFSSFKYLSKKFTKKESGFSRLMREFLNENKAIITSKIWIASAVFVICISVSDVINNGSGINQLLNNLYLSLTICVFLSIGGTFFSLIQNFHRLFFLIAGPITATNANFNLYLFIQNNPANGAYIDGRLAAPFGSATHWWPTSVALTYGMFLVGCFISYLETKVVYHKIIFALSSISLFLAMVSTQSRAAIGACITISLLNWIRGHSSQVSKLDRSTLSKVMVAFTPIMVVFSSEKIRQLIIQRGESHRLEIWKVFLQKSLAQPIIGYGQTIDISSIISNGERISHPHNIFLSSLIRGGAVALISMILIFLFSLKYSYGYLRKSNSTILISLHLVLFIAGIVDYEFWVTIADWYWVTLWLPISWTIGAEALTNQNQYNISENAYFKK